MWPRFSTHNYLAATGSDDLGVLTLMESHSMVFERRLTEARSMGATDYLLYRLGRAWPAPMKEQLDRLGGHEPGTEEHAMAYAQEQFDRKVRTGLGVAVTDRDVLEIGCGHGGISCYLASVGARRVVGIDLNEEHLAYGRLFAERSATRLGVGSLPVEFLTMNAYAMTFAPESFDLVVADNSFEHFDRPELVLEEAHRVLRSGGRLLVPSFSSILSKYGPHLKYGYHLPWTQLLFREETVVRTLHRIARDNPGMIDVYPGLARGATTYRGVRRHEDLNDITHRSFLQMANRTGFEVEWFKPFPTRAGYPVYAIRRLRTSRVLDVLSTGASAMLKKR